MDDDALTPDLLGTGVLCITSSILESFDELNNVSKEKSLRDLVAIFLKHRIQV